MKKGFTLIELLATILILGIIALIAIPVIGNVIEDARENAAKRSAENYVVAVEQNVMTTKLKAGVERTTFYEENPMEGVLYDGEYLVEELDAAGVEVKGSSPTEGMVRISKGQVVDCELVINGYTILCTPTDGEYEAKPSKGYDVEYGAFKCSLKGIGKVDPVYFNPFTGNKCTESEYLTNLASHVAEMEEEYYYWEETDSTYLNNGCMKWYPYHTNSNGTVDMILDHNVVNDVCWNEENNNSYNCRDTRVGGPINGVNVLREFTEDWVGVPVRTDKYEYETDTLQYTVNYNGMRAKLISAEEVAEITGRVGFSKVAFRTGPEGGSGGSSETFFLDSCFNRFYYSAWYSSATNYERDEIEKYLDVNKSNYAWLFEQSSCQYAGCNYPSSTNWGYMTSTALEGYEDWTNWQVFGGGALMENSGRKLGIRPVITINANIIK